MANRNTDRQKRRASNVLTAFNIVFMIAAVAIIVKIAVLQFIWEPDSRYISYFRPPKIREEIPPERGAIKDHNGKLLAISTPMYDIFMDCCVMKDEYSTEGETDLQEIKRLDSLERVWCRKASQLSRELPGVLKNPKVTAADYEQRIFEGRKKGARYVSIARNIDFATLKQLEKLTLFKERVYYSGMIVKPKDTRQYPYGDLARRVIGYVKHNSDTTSRHIGIEGKYDYILHGTKGVQWKRVTDNKATIIDVDSAVVEVQNGLDVRTTLDINIQDIADRALRKSIAKDDDIVAGCVVVLDVGTGAVRGMVNLQKTKNNQFKEVFNLAAGRPAEPGSVFKAVTVTTLLEDGCVKLSTEIPSNHGIMPEYPKFQPDPYVRNYERESGRNMISVQEGFKRSSNYVFRRLVYDNYKDRPEEFINTLHQYNFGEAYEFDLTEKGYSKPSIPDPDSPRWSTTDLISVAIGYAVKVTPLQVVTFYNAIANKGKMMKPYIVESIERGEEVVKDFKPVILNGSICSKATADTLTKALTVVTASGTARGLKNAKCTIAGKTGTARIHLSPEDKPKKGDPYMSETGMKKHQATFVGFFPAEEPKYSAIVVLYTGLMKHDVYGGNLPVATFKEIADELWAYEEGWGRELKSRGDVPQMRADFISTSKSEDTPVPDLTGLGLKDAFYAVENNGYRCRHSGTGHVVSQIPAAGSRLAKGQTIKIVLK